jgi:hypothetical protein
VTRIDMMKPQNVFEECAVGVCVLAVDDYVRAIDHVCLPLAPPMD